MGWIEIILCVPAAAMTVGGILCGVANVIRAIHGDGYIVKREWPRAIHPREERATK